MWWKHFKGYVLDNPMWFGVVGFLGGFWILSMVWDAPAFMWWLLAAILLVLTIGTIKMVKERMDRYGD